MTSHRCISSLVDMALIAGARGHLHLAAIFSHELVLDMQGETADDDGEEEEADPEKKVSKLSSFTWASKLSDAPSPSGASTLQPGLLQSLTGTFAGMLARTRALATFRQL